MGHTLHSWLPVLSRTGQESCRAMAIVKGAQQWHTQLVLITSPRGWAEGQWALYSKVWLCRGQGCSCDTCKWGGGSRARHVGRCVPSMLNNCRKWHPPARKGCLRLKHRAHLQRAPCHRQGPAPTQAALHLLCTADLPLCCLLRSRLHCMPTKQEAARGGL